MLTPMGPSAGPTDFPAQGADVRLPEIRGEVRLEHPDPGGGDDPDAALAGHGRGKAREGDAHAHPALNDGQGGDQISNTQRRHPFD